MDEPEQTPESLLDELAAAERTVRWKAARLLAHGIDVGRARGPHFRAACVPVLLEVLETHDADTAFDAEDAARRLVDIGERTADVRACMARCLSRAREELLSLEAALAPIVHLDLPERDILRARVGSCRSLAACLHAHLEDFRASRVASLAPPAAANFTAVAKSRRPGKAGNVSLVLPVLALLLVVGGVAALLLSYKRGSEVNLNSALPAVPSASAAPRH